MIIIAMKWSYVAVLRNNSGCEGELFRSMLVSSEAATGCVLRNFA